jgi:phage/plasmid-like protein (TIGR03299 family)
MAYVGAVPWHGLGTRLTAPPTAEEAIKAAGLDWEVEARQVYTLLHPNEKKIADEMMPADRYRAVVRNSDQRIMGCVGTQYRPLQNREAFNFFDPMVQAGLAEYHTAGSLKEGERVWVLAKLSIPTAEVVKGDSVESYLLLSNGHDGTHGVRVLFTPIRVVCWNTLSMATADRATGITFQHRGGVAETLEKARETIDLTRRTFAATIEQYQFLASRRVENLQSYVMQVLEIPADTKPEEMPKAVQEITTLYATGKGAELPGVAGTWWGAFNATTEWVDWKRGTNRARLSNAWFGIGASIKQNALSIATDLARAA